MNIPVVVAVIDDEQFAAGLARAFGHLGLDPAGGSGGQSSPTLAPILSLPR